MQQVMDSGILVIDKPPGITSAGVVAVVKRTLGLKKVGHAGTLDPFATGILVCLLNRATRLARFLVDGLKTYEAELLLGVETDTQDLTGRVVNRQPVAALTEKDVCDAAGRWVGEIAQQPPVYSALKHRGRPLYDLAREGRPVQKPPRRVTVAALDIVDVRLPRVDFRVTCSAGTYVRTLGADIGRELGCGGHLTALRRTASSGFTLTDAVTLAAFEAAAADDAGMKHMLPMAAAMPGAPVLLADEQLMRDIRHGRPIPRSAFETASPDAVGPIKVMTQDHHLAAVLLESADSTHFEYGCVLV